MIPTCLRRSTSHTSWFLIALVLIEGVVSLARAEEPAGAAKDKDRPTEPFQRFYRETAAGYDVRLRDAAKSKLPLHPAPLMRWNGLGTWSGAVFLWTHRERPELICDIHSSREAFARGTWVGDECYSVSLKGLSVVAPNGRRWEPKALEALRLLPDAPPPAETAAQRQIQIKQLVRDFTAHLDDRVSRWELRLLPQPLYRYEGQDPDVLSGALFAFVGYITDAEIILLVEARRTSEGPKWHYLPTRFSNKGLYLEHRNKSVWESPWTGPGGRGQPDTPDPQYGQVFSVWARIPTSGAEERGGP
jgi:hypothetical protein